MAKRKTAAVLLAAGQGTRMKSDLPKVLHALAGRPMIVHLLAGLAPLSLDRVVVVVGENMEGVRAAVAPHACVVQKPPLGTAHAVLSARDALGDFEGDLLVLYGDTPLVAADTLGQMLETLHGEDAPAAVVLGFRPADPGLYGRLLVDMDGNLEAIVEARDATETQARVGLCNSGVMALDGQVAFDYLSRIGNDNAKGEYYLTDTIAMARGDSRACAVVEGDPAELLGIDSRADLAVGEAMVQSELRARAMADGATLADPATVYFSFDTELGRDVSVGPGVVFGPGVVVGDHVEIRAYCHIEGAEIASGAVIGPFARLRPGAKLAEDVHIGNFVEVKNAELEKGAKANHLTYIGDARVGAGANVGAGTITCNYDGFTKSLTEIGAGAFIGSNTAFVAPVKVGDGALIGAGSVITKDVAADALAVTRAEQKEIKNGAKEFRGRKLPKRKTADEGGA